IKMCGSADSNIGVDSPDHTASWTAGYAQGTTVITPSSATRLSVGSTIWLDQLDDNSDGYPNTGDIYICAAAGCSNQGDGGEMARPGRAQTVGHRVAAING